MNQNHKWLKWAQKLQAIAQNGLTYNENPFDIERYQQVRQVAAEIIATHSDVELNYILNLLSNEVGYATPKVDVRAAVFDSDKILLVKEKEDGYWTLPGGWADVGESPSDAIVREVYEESGYHTRAIKLLAVYDRNHIRHQHPPLIYHAYKLFFQCELISGIPKVSFETEEVAFFKEQEIPALSLTRVVPGQIARMFEYYRDQDKQTDFD
ncbi:ADP-ribose pyrophosphatase YjhB, NUDIX family [Nostoc flagelliforme CCNUN1]|uniref:ADP-ribose pyrophosphatase YjhB, NUDIX family n=1 Tax=Nostoc flagelliforme CCNUN1 TaxID=2038116 RepID=A0A2K8T448_9NOSO|nr:NUDIX hydrolase [Nostoc flagelliforme]AUB42441.1 ADP-ribose pyrophosphatase YjhB, NUDIX family [Nostoc flagelliforme CCNUN1]